MRPFTTIVLCTTLIAVLTTGFADSPRTDSGPPVTAVQKQSSLTPGQVVTYLYDMNMSQSLPGVEVAKVTEHELIKKYHYNKEFLKPVTDLTLDPVWVYVRPSSIYTGHLARLHPGFNKPPSYFRKGIRNSKC